MDEDLDMSDDDITPGNIPGLEAEDDASMSEVTSMSDMPSSATETNDGPRAGSVSGSGSGSGSVSGSGSFSGSGSNGSGSPLQGPSGLGPLSPERLALMSFLRNSRIAGDRRPVYNLPTGDTRPTVNSGSPLRPAAGPSMFVHGDYSATTVMSDKNLKESDSYKWKSSTVDGNFSVEVDVPRLDKLRNIPAWQSRLKHSLTHLKTLMNGLPNDDNILHGLTDDEADQRLIHIFDPHLLLKDHAKAELQTQSFDGIALDRVPTDAIWEALYTKGLSLKATISKEGMLAKLRSLRMSVATYRSATLGYTVSSNFEKLFTDFDALIRDYDFRDFEGTWVLSHTLVSLIEPEQLRMWAIVQLYDACEVHPTTVSIWGKGAQPVVMNNTRAVYRYLFKRFVNDIDPAMSTSNDFLNSLVVPNFGPPSITSAYASMNHSPHSAKARSTTTKPQQSSSGKFQHSGDKKRALPDNSEGKDARKHPRKSSAPSEGKEAEPSSRVSKVEPKVKTRERRPPKDPCCLCGKTGHLAYKCSNTAKCTCGIAIGTKEANGRLHDPFRCPQGPLTKK